MYITARSVSRNGNPGGPAQAGTQPIPGRQGVGRTPQNASGVGAGRQRSTGLVAETASQNAGSIYGGQRAVAGLFGLRVGAFTGTTSAPARTEVKAVRTAQAKAVAPARPLTGQATVAAVLARLDNLRRQSALAVEAIADRDVYGGDARPSTPVMQAAASASQEHEEAEWREYAALVKFYPGLPYGCTDSACALND